MKSFKKVLSIVLALLMLCSCIAVSSISASALSLDEMDSEKYDDNILFSGDEFIRNYSYATYLTDNWPRQLSFNEDGWMRIQSQTAEEIAAGEPGIYDKQWSFSFIPTAEYQTQFKNGVKTAIDEGSAICYHYFYTKSAQIKGSKGTQDGVDYTLSYTIGADVDGDETYSYNITIGSQKNFTVKHPMYEYQYQNMAFSLAELQEVIDMEIDFKLKSVTYQPRNYDSEGIGLLDLYISPLYCKTVPGTDVSPMNQNDMAMLDIRNYLAGTTFTSGKLDRDGDGDPLNDWQWEEYIPAPDDDHPPIYGSEEYGKKGDIVRDPATRCPVLANGTQYNPIPIVQLVEEGPVVIEDLKAAVDGANATLTWKNTGSAASKYDITYKKDGKFVGAVSATTETYAFTGLEAGEYEATVVGFNVEGARSTQVKVTFTIATGTPAPEEPTVKPEEPTVKPEEPTVKPEEPTVKPEEPTVKPEKPTVCVHSLVTVGYKKATYFAAGYTGDKQCSKCKVVTAKGSAIAKLKLVKPKFSVKAGKKSFKVTYKKVAGATKFQVRYRIKGKWIVKEFKAKKNVTKTIKKLKKGTYKVQVRAMVQSGKLKAYSGWAKVQKAKVK